MVKLLVPLRSINLLEDETPVLFLAGPINSAPPWQEEAIRLVKELADYELYIACPKYELSNNFRDIIVNEDGPIDAPCFEKQLLWERYYMHFAASSGALMFWLPKPARHDCERTYARDTRGELGEYRGLMQYGGLNVVIGGEEGFDGLKVIKENFLDALMSMRFYETLEDTVKAALELIRRD
ncbi:MAG: hypothetical protein JW791_01840 [Nanoarchaeota archaeon]|nr:hypothetical protein [Nanoarchaeota archaeon]